MRSRFVIPTVVLTALASVLAGASSARAGDLDGQNAYANAQASGGQLTVQAGVTQWTPPAGSSWADSAGPNSSSSGGVPDPNQPYGCTYGAGGRTATASIGVGGPEPGQWVFPNCRGPGVIDPMPPIWVTGATAAVAAQQVDPQAVAEQAASQLGLTSPVIEMAPPTGDPQLVNVATWLWINPGDWQTLTASASVGTVTATATASPSKVVWSMGDGDTVTCDGPGTPYDAADPNAASSCSYTWSSAGTYEVTATIYWSVTWTAVGAPGGGNLGLQAGPAAQVAVTVTQSQAINTPTGGGN